MKRRRMPQVAKSVVVIIAAVGILSGCAGGPGGRGGGRIVGYAMPKGQVLKYKVSQQNVQTLEMMGQAMENKVDAAFEFSMESKGLSGDNLLLRITINSMNIALTTPQGAMSPDVSSVAGQSFDMTLSRLGKEIDVSGADSIHIDLGGGPRSMASDFQSFFPDLPGTPLKAGSAWSTADTVKTEEGGLEMNIITSRANTLQGFETVDGLECAKIVAAVTGTFGGKGTQMGAKLILDGKLEGTDTWYFAIKKGLLVKSSSDIHTDGTVVVEGAQAMTIPMKQEMKGEIVLAK